MQVRNKINPFNSNVPNLFPKNDEIMVVQTWILTDNK